MAVSESTVSGLYSVCLLLSLYLSVLSVRPPVVSLVQPLLPPLTSHQLY